MVAIYERALKDWLQGITANGADKWEQAYTAVCWFLSDDDKLSDHFPFLFICEIMGWSPKLIREKSAELFTLAMVEKLRRKLLSAANCFGARTKRWVKVHKTLLWVMSDDTGAASFIEACGCFGLDPVKVREELGGLLEGKREAPSLTPLRRKRYSTIN